MSVATPVQRPAATPPFYQQLSPSPLRRHQTSPALSVCISGLLLSQNGQKPGTPTSRNSSVIPLPRMSSDSFLTSGLQHSDQIKSQHSLSETEQVSDSRARKINQLQSTTAETLTANGSGEGLISMSRSPRPIRPLPRRGTNRSASVNNAPSHFATRSSDTVDGDQNHSSASVSPLASEAVPDSSTLPLKRGLETPIRRPVSSTTSPESFNVNDSVACISASPPSPSPSQTCTSPSRHATERATSLVPTEPAVTPRLIPRTLSNQTFVPLEEGAIPPPPKESAAPPLVAPKPRKSEATFLPLPAKRPLAIHTGPIYIRLPYDIPNWRPPTPCSSATPTERVPTPPIAEETESERRKAEQLSQKKWLDLAESMGIKIRDFAYEDHGVPTARQAYNEDLARHMLESMLRHRVRPPPSMIAFFKAIEVRDRYKPHDPYRPLIVFVDPPPINPRDVEEEARSSTPLRERITKWISASQPIGSTACYDTDDEDGPVAGPSSQPAPSSRPRGYGLRREGAIRIDRATGKSLVEALPQPPRVFYHWKRPVTPQRLKTRPATPPPEQIREEDLAPLPIPKHHLPGAVKRVYEINAERALKRAKLMEDATRRVASVSKQESPTQPSRADKGKARARAVEAVPAAIPVQDLAGEQLQGVAPLANDAGMQFQRPAKRTQAIRDQESISSSLRRSQRLEALQQPLSEPQAKRRRVKLPSNKKELAVSKT